MVHGLCIPASTADAKSLAILFRLPAYNNAKTKSLAILTCKNGSPFSPGLYPLPVSQNTLPGR